VAAALPAMMKVIDGEANERRRRWLTVTDRDDCDCGCWFTHKQTNEGEEE